MRNLLSPARLRLDAWHLQGEGVPIAAADTERLRSVLQEMLGLIDGLEWLRLDLEDPPLAGRASWAEAVGALLAAISGGTTRVAVERSATVRVSIPYVALMQQFVDVALAAQEVAGGMSWDIHVDTDDDEARAMVILTAAIGTSFTLLEQALSRERDPRAGAAVLRGEPIVHNAPQATTMQVQFAAPLAAREPRPGTPTNQATTAPLTVLCIDDNVALLDALAARLRRAPGFGQFLRASTVPDALTQLMKQSVSVILLDVQLSAPHDLQIAIAQLRACCPNASVAFFTGRADSALVAWARRHAVDGFVLKSLSPSVILDALARLGRGEAVWLTDDDV